MEEEWWSYKGHIGNFAEYGDSVEYPSRTWLAKRVNDGETILEIGYGAGKEYESLVNVHGKEIVYRGYDISLKFLEACQEKYPEGDFRWGDARELPEPSDSWDTVLCRHIIEYVYDWQQALKEAWRITNKRLIIISWRPLIETSSELTKYGLGGIGWKFNKDEFWNVLRQLTDDIEDYELPAKDQPVECNWAYILWKMEKGKP